MNEPDNEPESPFKDREAKLVELVWAQQKRLFAIPSVTSVGVGVRATVDPSKAEVEDLRIVIKTATAAPDPARCQSSTRASSISMTGIPLRIG